MRRRSIISACAALGAGTGIFTMTDAARGQPAGKVWRIGYLSFGSGPNENFEAFRAQLRSLGYVEGRNLAIEFRWAAGKEERLPELAAEMVRLKVDVIVTVGTTVALAAKRATETIPIVIPAAADPIGSGIVASLARPGGNVTGLSLLSMDVAGKRLQLLREIVPETTRVAVLAYKGSVNTPALIDQLVTAARQMSMTLIVEQLNEVEALAGAFESMKRGRAQALMVPINPFTTDHRKRIVEFATLHRLPTIFETRASVDVGGLMSYGPSITDMYRRAAFYVDKIFKGAKPADLPVEQPMRFEMVINLKTAKALGLTVPYALRLQATEMIE